MRTRQRFYPLLAVAIVLALLFPAIALAGSKTIYVNKGVSSARIGMKDSKAAKKIGKVAKKYTDNDYAGQTVYCFFFGKKSGGKYAVEMYAKKNHKVFAFVINSKSYKTGNGVGVGSSEARLKSKYPKIKNLGGSVYTRYHLGGSTGTDFYVKGGKVRYIQVWKY